MPPTTDPSRRTLTPCAVVALACTAVLGAAAPARSGDRLCDPAIEDCRAILIDLIRGETAGIDVAFWFMEDARYTTELIRRWQAGVPVRILIDTEANATNAFNAHRLEELRSAGIPMRERTGRGILHWKMMLFAGQNTVQFGGANYSADAFAPTAPRTNYTDEVIYFTDRAAVVGSFMTRFDDLWTNTTSYSDYANVPAAVTRLYPQSPKSLELNFPPAENYAARAVREYNRETKQIDVIMYRITDQRHTNAIISAVKRGVPVRLITEPEQYRDPGRLWHSWNVDRMYMAGVRIKQRAHAGLNHQKSVILHGRSMSIFGSSNWTSPSAALQEEHNYFTRDPAIFTWLAEQFERKWNNADAVVENVDFAPLPPDAATTPTPAQEATNVGTSVTLKWYAGPWAHVYDVYFGTTADPPLVAADLPLGPSASTASRELKQYALTGLAPATTYYWKIVSKTMASQSRTSVVWSFTTSPGPSRPATVLSPAVGSTLGGAVQTFTWDAGVGASFYWVNVGSSRGGYEYYSDFVGPFRTLTVSGLPTDGRSIWVRLHSFINGQYEFLDHEFVAAGPRPAVVIAPAPGGPLSGTTQTFAWDSGRGVSFFWIEIGSAQGGYEFYSNFVGAFRSLTVSGLPVDGRDIWVRLYSFIGGAYRFTDQRFTAAGPRAARLTSPAPGAVLSSSTQTFQWDAGVGVSGYWLDVGTSLGGYNLFSNFVGTERSWPVTGLPLGRAEIWVRLWSHIDGRWTFVDQRFGSSP